MRKKKQLHKRFSNDLSSILYSYILPFVPFLSRPSSYSHNRDSSMNSAHSADGKSFDVNNSFLNSNASNDDGQTHTTFTKTKLSLKVEEAIIPLEDNHNHPTEINNEEDGHKTIHSKSSTKVTTVFDQDLDKAIV